MPKGTTGRLAVGQPGRDGGIYEATDTVFQNRSQSEACKGARSLQANIPSMCSWDSSDGTAVWDRAPAFGPVASTVAMLAHVAHKIPVQEVGEDWMLEPGSGARTTFGGSSGS